MSAKVDVYNDIVTALEALVTDTVRDIKTVGFWNNQFTNEGVERSFNFPAVFIEFQETQWIQSSHAGANAGAANATGDTEEQKGNTVIILHIGFSELKNETRSFPVIDVIIEKVYFAIQNLQGANELSYSVLLRSAERQDNNHDRVIDWQMDFTSLLSQFGQNVGFTEVTGGVIELETQPLA